MKLLCMFSFGGSLLHVLFYQTQYNNVLKLHPHMGILSASYQFLPTPSLSAQQDCHWSDC